jgi:hypothetical protein
MTDAPQANTEAARPKGSNGMHWLSGPYILTRPPPGPLPKREGELSPNTEAFRHRLDSPEVRSPFPIGEGLGV